MSQAKRVVLVSRPVGEPKASDFRVEDYAQPSPGAFIGLLKGANFGKQLVRVGPDAT